MSDRYWAIRRGIFPTVGGMRPNGTSCLIEDVAFPIDKLPEATVKLQRIIASHGYADEHLRSCAGGQLPLHP